MPAVFVHGVPDTPHVWHRVVDAVDRDDIHLLSLPGFETPRPDGWGATKEDYVDWVVDRLVEIHDAEGPVDLVGHDWGSLLTIRVASTRGDLLRTWAAGNGPVDETYVWHDTAQAWQTPEVGEQVMAMMTAEAMLPTLEAAGLHPDDAAATAAGLTEDMKSCILDLYRSAVDVGAEWGPDVDGIDVPGLALWATDDPFVPVEYGERLAARTGATLVTVPSGHWWPLQAPDAVATALQAHWAVG